MAEKAKKARLWEFYNNTVAPKLKNDLGYKNVMEIPKISKIIVCMGLGSVKDNSKSFNLALDELTQITGQKAVPTVAKKSISNFKHDGITFVQIPLIMPKWNRQIILFCKAFYVILPVVEKGKGQCLSAVGIGGEPILNE